jgi:hypothetical protein
MYCKYLLLLLLLDPLCVLCCGCLLLLPCRRLGRLSSHTHSIISHKPSIEGSSYPHV